jgi:hypothetical protein
MSVVQMVCHGIQLHLIFFFFLIDALDFTPVYESLITSMEIYEWGYAFHYKIFLAILNHSFKVEMVSYSNKTSLKFWIAFLGRNS